ncbi:sensor histidine kinase [Helicobacter himalayensis]|uniref:sensor histidine kinase n=1 Tax=Helicobacter himalayensis TaxID=1591088 RepID=UPI0008346067|nr:HAMP domain-containing sensor histidine kinase [Helicobacter himalayensis]
MSVSSNAKTIAKILTLYLGTSIVLLCWVFYFLHKKEKRNIVLTQVASLREVSTEINEILKKYKFEIQSALPEILKNHVDMSFGIFDHNGEVLYSNLLANPNEEQFNRGIYDIGNKVIIDPEGFPHRNKRVKYRIFIQDDKVDSKIMLNNLKLGAYFVLILLLMGVVAFVLVKFFLKPINAHIQQLDTFIKDATHEINTPLSIILMSIETLKTHNLNQEDKKKIARIKLASLQLGQVYQALVASNFPHSIEQMRSNLALDSLLNERLEFFAPFFSQKKLQLQSDIKPAQFYASKEKIITLFDNLLNNAIKYTKKSGFISLKLESGLFEIANTSAGLGVVNKERIFERYERFNRESGGFGIGLSLVKQICDEYKISITTKELVSQNGEVMVQFSLRWENEK